MELVQTLLIPTTAVASLDSLDRIAKVSLENKWRVKLESEIEQSTHNSPASETLALQTKLNSKSGRKISVKLNINLIVIVSQNRKEFRRRKSFVRGTSLL